MFIGNYKRRIDRKGHLILPRSYLGPLAPGAVITFGLDNNLLLFPLSYWEVMVEKIHQLPFSKEVYRSFRRFFFSNAHALTPDQRGRIFIPMRHREAATIRQDVMILGLYNYIEIWGVQGWDAEQVRVNDVGSDVGKRWELSGI